MNEFYADLPTADLERELIMTQIEMSDTQTEIAKLNRQHELQGEHRLHIVRLLGERGIEGYFVPSNPLLRDCPQLPGLEDYGVSEV